MDDTVLDEQQGTTTPSRRRILVALACALVVLVATGFGVSAWQHSAAHVFAPYGNELGGPLPVGKTVYVPVTIVTASGKPELIDLRSIHARVRTNTVGGRVSVLACTLTGGEVVQGALSLADTQRGCADVRPYVPGRHRFGGQINSTGFVIKIAAQRPGKVVVQGVHVHFRSGWRQGEQDTGTNLVFIAR